MPRVAPADPRQRQQHRGGKRGGHRHIRDSHLAGYDPAATAAQDEGGKPRGARAAWFATLILGCCGGWIVSSQVGVPDMPMTATFSAAMLLALTWIGRRDARHLPVAAALLGLAVLAKGPVALVLAAPLGLRFRSARDLVRPWVVAPFLAVALPWYLLCYLRNGKIFLHDFFVVHNFERFTSNALMHVQPWW